MPDFKVHDQLFTLKFFSLRPIMLSRNTSVTDDDGQTEGRTDRQTTTMPICRPLLKYGRLKCRQICGLTINVLGLPILHLHLNFNATAIIPRIHRVSKNIPDIFDCNLKSNYKMLIIFGTNIPDTTCC